MYSTGNYLRLSNIEKNMKNVCSLFNGKGSMNISNIKAQKNDIIFYRVCIEYFKSDMFPNDLKIAIFNNIFSKKRKVCLMNRKI